MVYASPTKSFNLAGLKASYAVAPDPGFKRRFQDALKLTGTSSINIYVSRP